MIFLIFLFATENFDTSSVSLHTDTIYVLPDIFIYARTQDKNLSSIPVSFTVIKQGVPHINSNFVGTPGVNLKNYYSIQGVTIRGASSEEVKTFVAGYPFYPRQSGFFNLSIMPTTIIGELEVLKTINSSDFGAGAMGGAVNLRLNEPLSMFLLQYSTLSRIGLLAAHSIYSRTSISSITLAYEKLPGEIKTKYNSKPYRVTHMGGNKTALTWRLLHRSWELLVLGGVDSRALPWFPWSTNKSDTLRTWYSLIGVKTTSLRLTLNFFKTLYREESQTSSIHNELGVNARWNLKNLYLEIDGTGVKSTSIGFRYGMNIGIGYSIRREVRGFDIWGSLRLDLYERSFVPIITGFIGVMGKNGFYANASNGFRPPTFNELYWTDDPYARGNPDLIPERAKEFELGWKKLYKHFYFDVTVFRRKYSDMIRWTPDSTGSWHPINLRSVSLSGIDGSVSFNLENFGLSLGFSIVKNSGKNNLVYYPDTSYFFLVSLFNFFIRWGHLGSRPERTTGPKRMKGFNLLDIWFEFKSPIFPFSLKTGILNLLNTSYELVRGIPMPGRDVFLELNLKKLKG